VVAARSRAKQTVVGVALFVAGVLVGALVKPSPSTPVVAPPVTMDSVIAGVGGTAVDFVDASDKAHPAIRVACAGPVCRVVVRCDNGHPSCADLAKRMPAAFTRQPDGYQFQDSSGRPHHVSLLVVQLFLAALNASTDYQLTWQSAQHPTPATIPR
jgi:hypothetical protein